MTDDQLVQHEIARVEAAYARRGETLTPVRRAALKSHLCRPESLSVLRQAHENPQHDADALLRNAIHSNTLEWLK